MALPKLVLDSRAHLGPASAGTRAVIGVDWALGVFNQQLMKLVETFGLNSQKAVMSEAFTLEGMFKLTAPVDTGRFRSSIHTVRPDTTKDSYSYTDRTGKVFNGSLQGQTGSLECIVGTNVEYAVPLEYGWSKQAPSGVFRINIERRGNQLAAKIESLNTGIDK